MHLTLYIPGSVTSKMHLTLNIPGGVTSISANSSTVTAVSSNSVTIISSVWDECVNPKAFVAMTIMYPLPETKFKKRPKAILKKCGPPCSRG